MKERGKGNGEKGQGGWGEGEMGRGGDLSRVGILYLVIF
jgi:hypothetical protein